MRAASDQRIGFEGAFKEHINLCLACRSCVTACPSGVQYGALIEMARHTLEQNRSSGQLERFIRWLALESLMPEVDRLKLIARLIRFYQRSGIDQLVSRFGLLPSRFESLEALLPPMPESYSDYRKPALTDAPSKGAVAFFYGCVQEAFLAQVNAATVRVLQRNGFDVHFPQAQTCCGAAQLHLGEVDLARRLARQNIDAFFEIETPVMAIINNAGGCGATLKEYDQLLADDPQYAEKARDFSAKVKDISEFLVEHLNKPPAVAVKLKVVYSDSCHLRHAQKVIDQPRILLETIPGLELVEIKHPEFCCGSAGVYNIVNQEIANQILDLRMADICETSADAIVVSNTGCYFQLLKGVRSRGESMKVIHLVELLDEAYG
jgi:glycolate oxidase iron-sulfur subunit